MPGIAAAPVRARAGGTGHGGAVRHTAAPAASTGRRPRGAGRRGYHGTWLTAVEASTRTLAAAGLGAGVLMALPGDRCGPADTAQVLRHLALESAGQCGPCLNGLPRIAAAFRTLAAPGPQGTGRQDIARWAGLVEGAAPATTRTARSAWSAARSPPSPPNSTPTPRVTARCPATGPRCPSLITGADVEADLELAVDWTACKAHGRCAELLPEHITLDEWGYPCTPQGPLPRRPLKRARRAAADCPVLALRLSGG
ncbi:ferredoxin [Streptomyces sp. NPDC058637]|uniref:ferredoxin n=1 Tax=Streptomyces sp. NPDC058637 TaxID=3346569 RepID=UPI00364FE5A0